MSGFLSVLVSYGATAVKAAYQKIIASDTASQAGANFGSAIALSGDGNYIVVGSALAGSTDDGAVYVYYNNSGTWEEQAKLVASNAVAGDWFGCAVDITKTGDRIIVGAQQANGLPYNQNNSGAAYIFQRTGTTWAEEVYISGGDGGSNDYFGNSVAINDDGTAIFIGAYGDDAPGTNVGWVHTYLIKGTSWAGIHWKNDDDALPTGAQEDGAYHGWSIACNADGTRCIEGAYGDNNQGKTNNGVVTIHHRNSLTSAWTKDIWLEPPYPANNGRFGWSVAMDGAGERVAIGAMGESPTGITGAGAAYIYKRTGTVWALEAQLTADVKEAGDKFGYSVSINAAGDKVTIGTIYANIPTKAAAGVVYVFERSSSIWTQSSKLTAGDAEAGDNLGSAVSLNDAGTGVVVGSLGNDPLGSIDSGAAYYFPLAATVPFVPSDPYWANVMLLINADGMSANATNFVDKSNYSSPLTIAGNSGATDYLVCNTAIKPSTTGSTGSIKFGGATPGVGAGTYIGLTAPLVMSNTAWTMEAWIHPVYLYNSGNDHNSIFIWGTELELWLMHGGQVGVTYNSSPWSGPYSGPGGIKVLINEWSHIAAVYNGTVISIYVNGVLWGTKTGVTNFNNTAKNMGIGSHIGGNSEVFRGYMNDLRITNGVARYTGATYTIPTTSFYS
jgi:hypothetical protein